MEEFRKEFLIFLGYTGKHEEIIGTGAFFATASIEKIKRIRLYLLANFVVKKIHTSQSKLQTIITDRFAIDYPSIVHEMYDYENNRLKSDDEIFSLIVNYLI